MAHSEHMHRRAFLKGAATAIIAANVAGTAAAASFPDPSMMRMEADGMLAMYERNGVNFIPQPNGRVAKSIFIGDNNLYDHEVVSGLDKQMDDRPELRQAVIDRVREIYGLSA